MKDSIDVPAPRDAKGREVPLDVKMMYDNEGVEYGVCCLVFRNMTEICEAGWTVELTTTENKIRQVSLEYMYLKPPDSLKKLLEDLDRAANAKGFACCAYVGRSEWNCTSCIAAGDSACTQPIMRDIAFRIRELVGEDE